MPGVFVNYRRDDTGAPAGHLFEDLRKNFGPKNVFMDIKGGIPQAADLDAAVRAGLADCAALLALIGPSWSSCTRMGRRRLEFPDDWVRTEIATALAANVPVVPVLFGNARMPGLEELPEDLHAMTRRAAAEISETRWQYDADTLIKSLLEQIPALKALHDIASASSGIELVKDLIATIPSVAAAVGQSRVSLEHTCRELAALQLYKTIHDALHLIEVECLLPMQRNGAPTRMRPYKVSFCGFEKTIRAALARQELIVSLQDQLDDQLKSTRAAFEAALAAPGESAYEQVLGELNGLLSGISPRLDDQISSAAAKLELENLVRLMESVRDVLRGEARANAAGLEQLFKSIDAIKRLAAELANRVSEHANLQALDMKLRAVCLGSPRPGTLSREWERIKNARSKLVAPFSEELSSVNDDLVAIESGIESGLKQGNEAAAADELRDYFTSVSSVFRNVDSALKAFCLQLGTVSQTYFSMLLTPAAVDAKA